MQQPTYNELPEDVRAALEDEKRRGMGLVMIDPSVPKGMVRNLATGKDEPSKSFIRAVRKRERQNRKNGRKKK